MATERDNLLPTFRFVVQLVESGGDARTVAGFSECSGLESTLEVEEYQEGGINDRVHKFPSRFTFGNITLKRGMTTDNTLAKWHFSLLQGTVERRDGLILLLNEAQEPVLAWKFERGLPVKWTGPGLNAASSEVAVETLEIAHERLEHYLL
ncbi:MAG: phage tail protein [Anaerolineae bacterium]|jgi:phage tail-like protein